MYKRQSASISLFNSDARGDYTTHNIKKRASHLLIATLLLGLQACTSLQKVTQSLGVSASPDTDQSSEASKPDYGDFDLDKDTLYDLMVAEIAAQRGQFNITLVNYIQQARATRDVAIVKRAINAAQYSKDLVAIQEMGLLWLEIEPDNEAAHQLMAFQYSLQKQYADAMYHIDRIIEIGGDARVESLAVGSHQVSEADKLELLQLYTNLQAKHPNNFEITYSIALVERNLKRLEDALARLNTVIKNEPEMQSAAVLKADILHDLGRKNEALLFAEEKFDQFPENHALGRFYASLLIDKKRLDEAEDVFEDLMERYPQAPGFKLSLALVMLENGKTDGAKKQFEELIERGAHLNESHFYLARIADQKGDSDTAMYHYSQVKEGTHYEASLERYSYLLTQDDRTDEAIAMLEQLRQEKPNQAHKLWIVQYKLMSTIGDEERMQETLNQAIADFPDDEQLRYARAMNYVNQDNLQAMEADLRHIIDNNPKHAVAINALGYTLADRTDRLQEALGLITLALSLKPENPAIIDSMGWVLYRLGRKEEALLFLMQAYQRYQEAEVAAHLGEVLWEVGKHGDAKLVWRDMLRRSPKHTVLRDTITRYHPPLIGEVETELADENFDLNAHPLHLPTIEVERRAPEQ